MNWPTVKLGEIVALNPKEHVSLNMQKNDEVTFIPMQAVSELSASIENFETRQFHQVSRGFTTFIEDDVLFAKITPCMENGKVALARGLLRGFGFGSTEFHVLRATGSVLAEYVYFFVRQQEFRDAAKLRMQGAVGQQRVPTSFFEEYPLLLPPLPEQQRIVATLRQADALRHLRREADKKIELLIKSVFYDMFGDPNAQRNDRGWPMVTIGSQVQVETGGTPPRKQDVFYGGRHAWLRTTELRDSLIDHAEETLSDAGMKVSNTKTFPVDTVVVAMYGQGQTRGRTGKLAIPAATNQACAAFLPSENLLPNYLWYWFQCSYEDVRNLAQGGNQFNLNLSILKNLLVPKPSAELQKQFSEMVDYYLELQKQTTTSTNTFDTLLTSLSAQAFTSDLTAAWREQHAAELRIAAARRDALLRDRGVPNAEPSAAEVVRSVTRGKANRSIDALMQGLYDSVRLRWDENAVSLAQPIVESMRGYVGKVVQEAAQRMQNTLADSVAVASQTAVARMSEALAAPISTFIEQTYASAAAISFGQEIADHPRGHLLQRLPVSHVLVWLVINNEAGYATLESLSEATGLTHKALERILDVFHASGLLTAVSLPTNPSGIRVFVPAYRAYDAERDEARADDLDVLQDSLSKQ